MAQLLKQATRERLKEALYDMTILHDDGMSPRSALTKVANEYGLEDEQIRFVGRAFNTAQTNTHREEGQTLLEKLGSCPIVDAEEVISRRRQMKLASAPAKTAAVYDTTFDKQELVGLPQRLKVAAYQFPDKPKQVIEPVPPLSKLASDTDYLERQQRTLSGKVYRLKEEFEKQAAVLRGEVKKFDRDRQTVLKLAALQRLGRGCEVYLTGIIDRDIRVPVKTASVVELDDPVIRKFAKLKETGEALIDSLKLFQKVSRALNIADGSIWAKTGFTKKQAANGTNNNSGTNNNKKKPPEPKGFFEDWAGEARRLRKQHAEDEKAVSDNPWISNPVGTTLNKSKGLWELIKNPAPSPDSGYAMTLPTPHQQFGLDTPSQQFKLDRIKVKSLLNDLISNDEIIGAYDNDEVVSAYNELSDSAPEAMKRPAIARAMLREHLAKGSLGNYDLSPLLQYEKQFIDLQDKETKGDTDRQRWFDSPSGRYMSKEEPRRQRQDDSNSNKPPKK